MINNGLSDAMNRRLLSFNLGHEAISLDKPLTRDMIWSVSEPTNSSKSKLKLEVSWLDAKFCKRRNRYTMSYQRL